MKQSVQMWDNKRLTVLEGEPVYGFPGIDNYTFLCCPESKGLFSIVCVECGLRVCYGCEPVTAIRNAHELFSLHNKHGQLRDYMRYTTAAYHAYLAYVWARAGMWEHSPSNLLSQPRFPLFNHHNMENI